MCGSLYYNLLWFSWKGCCLHRSSPRLWSACTFGCVYCNCWGIWTVCWLNDSWMMGSTDSHLCASNAHTLTFIQQTPLCTVWRQFQSLFISSPPLLYAHTLWCTFEKLPLCKGLIWFFVRRMSFIWATHGRMHKSRRNAIDTLFVLTPLCLSHTHHDGDFPSTVFHCYFYPPIRHFLSLTLKSNPHWNI